MPDGLLDDGQQKIKHKIIENDIQKEAEFISNKVDKTQLDAVEKSLECNRSAIKEQAVEQKQEEFKRNSRRRISR